MTPSDLDDGLPGGYVSQRMAVAGVPLSDFVVALDELTDHAALRERFPTINPEQIEAAFAFLRKFALLNPFVVEDERMAYAAAWLNPSAY